MILEVFDKNLKRLAYLENAFNKNEDIKINSIYYLNFSIPADDPKVKYLQPYYYVKCNKNLYRILPKTIETDDLSILNVECEHVLATLLNDVIFGHVIIGNLGTYTKEVINYVLNKQKTKNWKLGICEFSRQFEYAWENENLAAALFSIPKPIAGDYIWTYDTESYPWTINLLKLDTSRKPDIYVQKKKNMLRIVKSSDPKQLFTRIYPLGYGEGINQLNIKDINNGVPYLQSPQFIVDKYGIIETIWIDRRYENVESLKDAAQQMLNEFQEPLQEFEIDYQSIDDREKLELGNIIKGEDFKDVIVGINYNYDDIKTTKILIANKGRTVATSIADLADRQRIEMTYSQGATQLYAQSLQVNASNKDGAELNFFIPNEMRIINKVIAKIKLESFRAYSKATVFQGNNTATTSSQPSDTYSSSWGGGGQSYGSTSSGGGSYGTTHGASDVQSSNIWHQVQDYSGKWIGRVEINKVTYHSHQVSIPDHSHSVMIDFPSHSHSVMIPSHSHSVDITHEHEITPGIYRFGNSSGFTLKVNGKVKGYFNNTNIDLDLTKYLLDNKNRISRGSWQSIEIIPNNLAYVSMDLMLQGFVQSRGDYTV